MAYCLFTAAIPLANLVAFVLCYLGMQDTGALLASQAWESNYLSEYTLSLGSVNQPAYSTSAPENDDDDPTVEEAASRQLLD